MNTSCSQFQSSFTAPQYAGPVDRLERFADLKAAAKVVDGSLAICERTVIINHHEAT